VFTMVNAVLLRMLPVKNPQELVLVEMRLRGDRIGVSQAMAQDLLKAQQAFSDTTSTVGIGVGRARFGSTAVDGVIFSPVSHNYFALFGLQPAAGRFFEPDDDSIPGSFRRREVAAVISDRLWGRQFGRDPSVLGRRFLYDGAPCRVIGVAPRGFTG